MKPSVAIITGASQGIGHATALRLARDFSGVVLAARNGEALNQAAALVKRTGAEPLPMPLDLREPSAAKTLVDGTLIAGRQRPERPVGQLSPDRADWEYRRGCSCCFGSARKSIHHRQHFDGGRRLDAAMIQRTGHTRKL